MEENLSRLWQNLRQKTPEFTIDYEQFKVDMQNEDNLLKLHTNLTNRDKNFNIDYNT